MDESLRTDTSLRKVVREVHPEVCFCLMAGGRAMQFSKKTAAGVAERRDLLHSQFGRAADDALAQGPRSGCATDDLLDALAALWTARRILNGTSVTLPSNPQQDEFGLPMEIVA
jgi:predicted RNase H-like nuclease